jgi:hypothetical protein
MTETNPTELVELRDCPPGPFLFNGTLGFKTEYGATQVDENGAAMCGSLVRFKISNWPDAYCMESGEFFWGGTTKHEDRARLLVQPIDGLDEAAATITRLTAENERLRGAVTPSGYTKAAYMGEFSFDVMFPSPDEDDDEPVSHPVPVPWDTIKEIMTAIAARSTLEPQP